MTYADLFQILMDAKARVKYAQDPGIRERSAETVALCNERMRRDGLTLATLRQLAKRKA